MWNKFTSNIDVPTSRPSLSSSPLQNGGFSPSGSIGPSFGRRLVSDIYGARDAPRLTPRSSSLNLALGNSSNASLSGGRPPLPDRSSYKKAISAPRPSGVKDPLDVLKGILGDMGEVTSGDGSKTPRANGFVSEHSTQSSAVPDLYEEDIDFGGLSFEDFVAKEKEEETTPKKPIMVRRSTTSYLDYFGVVAPTKDDIENEKYMDLHKSIKACDEVLQNVEVYLSSFKSDLGHVSAEIETLQNRSMHLNTRLENRKTVERLVGPVLEDIALAPSVVRRIAEGDVNDHWVKTLQEADKKIKALDARKSQNIKAADDVRPELERLTHKALERVRDYFVAKIKSLRVPNANAQVIQRTAFLKYKELFVFMAQHHPQLADEIGQAYINTMKWYYLNHFTRYQKSLEKTKLFIMDKTDLLGQDEAPKRSALLPGLKANPTANHDPFNLGRRLDTFKNQEAPLPAAHMAEEDKTSHFPEYLFRCFNVAIIDNACAEFSFLTEFFAHKKYDQISVMFHQIFDSTLALGRTFTKSLVEITLDSLAILLCVRINQQMAFILQRRRVPVLDSYINATNMLLWPRFQVVMDAHSESLKKIPVATGKSAAVDISKQSAAPHLLTQRFAQFVYSLLVLSAEAGDDEPVSNSLGRLRGDFEGCLTKLSVAITDKNKRERFLYNNYSLVLTIIGDTEGKLATEQKAHFEALTKAYESGR